MIASAEICLVFVVPKRWPNSNEYRNQETLDIPHMVGGQRGSIHKRPAAFRVENGLAGSTCRIVRCRPSHGFAGAQ